MAKVKKGRWTWRRDPLDERGCILSVNGVGVATVWTPRLDAYCWAVTNVTLLPYRITVSNPATTMDAAKAECEAWCRENVHLGAT